MKTIAGHQPNYLPWAGYFYKMLACDDFIFGDDLVMSRHGFTNRNRVKTKDGVLWLSIPCRSVCGETLIKDVAIADERWRKKHVRTLEVSYKKAPYYEDYMPRFREIILSNEESMRDLNIRLIKQIAQWLDISCTFHLSSALGVSSTRDDRIVDLVTRLGGQRYVSGHGGANYQSEEKFKNANLDVVYCGFQPPIYPQLWGKFEPGLSIVDLLFNCGPDCREILEYSGSLKNKPRNGHRVCYSNSGNLVQWERNEDLSPRSTGTAPT